MSSARNASNSSRSSFVSSTRLERGWVRGCAAGVRGQVSGSCRERSQSSPEIPPCPAPRAPARLPHAARPGSGLWELSRKESELARDPALPDAPCGSTAPARSAAGVRSLGVSRQESELARDPACPAPRAPARLPCEARQGSGLCAFVAKAPKLGSAPPCPTPRAPARLPREARRRREVCFASPLV